MLTETPHPGRQSGTVSGWRRHFHFDFHVLLVLVQRGWGVIAGAVTVVFIPLWFTQVEQGYYYAFLSLLALQVFFELGFNFVIMQLVGHEAARLTIDASGTMRGDAVALSRMRSLLTLFRSWYVKAGILFFIVVSAVGFFFFRTRGVLPIEQWFAVWITLVFFTSINLYLSPQLAVLEGIGRVGHVARLRLAQSVGGYSLMWVALSLGAGLYALPAIPITAAVLTLWWLREHRGLLHLPRSDDSGATSSHVMRWRTDVFPLQWRIALSWTSGYFIFNSFTLFIFSAQGAVEAGRIGLSISIFSSLSALGMSWVSAAAPKMVNHVARNDRVKLNALFIVVLKSSVLFALVSSCCLLMVVAILTSLEIPVVQRIASLPILGCLALVGIANSFIFAAATYMRAHKREPLLAASVVGGLLTLAAAYLGSTISSLMTMSLYAALTLFVGLPWTVLVFQPYFRNRVPGQQADPRVLSGDLGTKPK